MYFVFILIAESPLLQMDELCEKVRANVKRCIVVLREIPEATPLEVCTPYILLKKCCFIML